MLTDDQDVHGAVAPARADRAAHGVRRAGARHADVDDDGGAPDPRPPRLRAAAPCREGVAATVPTWRLQDTTREIDLVEEVGRIHGLDELPADDPGPHRRRWRAEPSRRRSAAASRTCWPAPASRRRTRCRWSTRACPTCTGSRRTTTRRAAGRAAEPALGRLRPDAPHARAEPAARDPPQPLGRRGRTSACSRSRTSTTRPAGTCPSTGWRDEPWTLGIVLSGRLGGDVVELGRARGRLLHREGRARDAVRAARRDRAARAGAAAVPAPGPGGADPARRRRRAPPARSASCTPSTAERFELEGRVAVLELDLDVLAAEAPARFTYRPVPEQPPVLQDIAVVVAR